MNPSIVNNHPISFDMVIKVTERCNLNCSYCYYFNQEYDANGKFPSLNEEVSSRLPQFLLDSTRELNIDLLRIVFHGGEPLLMSYQRFDKLCTRISEALRGKVDCKFAIQTNGVLVNEKWIELFEKHKISVGVSIDGGKIAHDRFRLDHSGKGSYDRAVAGYMLLQKAHEAGRIQRPGILGVIPPTGGTDMLRHFVEDLGVSIPNLNYPRGGKDNADVISWNESIESHRELVKYYLDKLVFPKTYKVRGISEYLAFMVSENIADLHDIRNSSRHYIATISSEGDLMVDDNLIGTDPQASESGLNIFKHSLRDLVESSKWQELNNALTLIPEECSKCQWYRSCGSGALYNRFSKRERYEGKSALCETIKMIHEEVFSFVLKNGLSTIPKISNILKKPPTTDSKELYGRLVNKESTVGV